MKKLISLLTLLYLAWPSLAQNQAITTPKLSPLLRKYIQDVKEHNGKPATSYVFRKLADGKLYTGVLIKVYNAAAAESSLKNMQAHIGTKAGNIWTVKVPQESIPALAQLPGVSYIQMDEPVQPDMDQVRKTTRTDSVHNGYGLPQAYTGKGVVVGIIDFGFDYHHPTLYDTLGQSYRVKKVWELNTNGTPPTGYNYGHELKDTSAILADSTDNPKQTHGTGVSGIAAGSGFGSNKNSKYRGIAFESDMVFVGVRRDSIGEQWMQGGFSDFVDGISYIFKYAGSVYKPAVVNISWGSQSGPHDGSTLFNEACDNLSGPGRIVVMSAGNEGEEKIHLAKTFTPTDTLLRTFLSFSPAHYQRTWVDAWGEQGKTFCAKVTLYNNGVAGDSTEMICIDDNIHNDLLIAANGNDTCFVEFITSASEFNNKPRLTVNLYNKSADSMAVTIRGTDGSIHVWDEYYYYGYTNGYQSGFSSNGRSWATEGNTVTTVSDMGSAESVLLVGAYASKTGWMDMNANTWSYNSYVSTGQIVPFSSRGPMADGRIKPDIAAPGLTLATAYSSFDHSYTPQGSNSSKVVARYTNPTTQKNYYYGEFIGTSASGPVASGIVALMLQAHPGLTPKDVKNIIFETAIKDIFTGNLPAQGNNIWGHGKINAYGAVKGSIKKAGIGFVSSGNLDCILYPNPNNGKFTVDYFNSSNNKDKVTFQVYSLTGSLVLQQAEDATAGKNLYGLDLSHLSKGLYLVHISSAEGSLSVKTLVQ